MNDRELEYVRMVAEKYQYGGIGLKQHVEHVAEMTKRLAACVAKLGIVSLSPDHPLLAVAVALPHDIGRNAIFGQGRHNVLGFSGLTTEFANGPLNQRDSITIRYSTLFHAGDDWRSTKTADGSEMERLVRVWGGMLRAADGLDFRALQSAEEVVIKIEAQAITCNVTCGAEAYEIDRARQKTDLLRDLGLEVTVV